MIQLDSKVVMEGTFMGVSFKKIAETILAILALVFLLVGKGASGDAFTQCIILSIIVVSYLGLIIIMSFSRREASGVGSSSFECATGALLLIYNIVPLYRGTSGTDTLIVVAYALNIVVGFMFLVVTII